MIHKLFTWLTAGFSLWAMSLAVLGQTPAAVPPAAAVPAPEEFTVKSPDGKIVVTLAKNAAGALIYSAKSGDRTVIEASRLGPIIDGEDLGGRVQISPPARQEINETYARFGSHAQAVNHCLAANFPITGGGKQAPWSLQVRVFNDGLAFRYVIPGEGPRQVNGEATEWKFPSGGDIWFQPDNNRMDYEALFQASTLGDLQPGRALAAPATLRLNGTREYITLTEANLIGYSDMILRYAGDNTFKAFFHAQPQGWDWVGEIVSPWRVAILARDLTTLVNTDIVQNLCPAPLPELAGADWIQPGRSSWHWMVSGAPRFAQQRSWVDWTAQLGFEYYIIDDGWKRWNEEGKDAWACMTDVTAYARTKGVKIIAWVNSNELLDAASREAYFTKANAAGVAGLKIDFMKPADPVWAQWYDDTLRDAAKAKLMISFHGCVKPTGRERTWPNEITREAVHGRESNNQPAAHVTILPFVRYVQGHGDFTPTDFRPEKINASSYGRELGMAVIYNSPLLVYSGSPQDYFENEALDVLKAIPPTWDETVVLPGSEPGQVVAMARRRGREWFIGVVNGSMPVTLSLALGFLPPGQYRAVKLADAPERHDAWERTESTVSRETTLDVPLATNGGFVARLVPVTP